MRLKIILSAILSGLLLIAQAQIKIGIIGLDTSHSVAFTKFLNGEDKKEEFKEFRIVAAYPYGSKTIKTSYDRIPGYIEQVKELGVEITPSIAELLDKVDCVMLETNDGNLHLEQAYEVFKAGKIVFIDKPIGANLAQSIAIFRLAKQYNVPVFSSSALRYVSQSQKLRNGELGKVLGADCYSPAHIEPSHADMAWYGIHGTEALFTVMGTGCVSVNRMSSEGTDVIVGLWDDGRIGTVRGARTGKSPYGGNAFTDQGVVSTGVYEGYEALLKEILKFFKTRVSPVTEKETLEIFTFIEAADISKSQGGKIISMDATYQKGIKEAQKLIRKLK
ncbi:Gfo/Idh/MocA family oxidoreductase [uncultured Proteiniphilum sp.]|uniref:Gfo/Idh/MocA family protein n=1 Tax=uncultured Proteiniphilum sp. TaxID=497637 RepID=UPI00261B8B10|nr:Gfo/Idh/MocA family oxidoreductase [uncultured Proteiniphilum sp.]